MKECGLNGRSMENQDNQGEIQLEYRSVNCSTQRWAKRGDGRGNRSRRPDPWPLVAPIRYNRALVPIHFHSRYDANKNEIFVGNTNDVPEPGINIHQI